MDQLERDLQAAARTAAGNAHCPYSQFRVGAAIADAQGQIFSGCNVENASYGLTCCAERTAIFSAIAAGADIAPDATVVIYTPGSKLYTSCGACRQVIAEFCPQATMISTCDGPDCRKLTMAVALGDPFRL